MRMANTANDDRPDPPERGGQSYFHTTPEQAVGRGEGAGAVDAHAQGASHDQADRTTASTKAAEEQATAGSRGDSQPTATREAIGLGRQRGDDLLIGNFHLAFPAFNADGSPVYAGDGRSSVVHASVRRHHRSRRRRTGWGGFLAGSFGDMFRGSRRHEDELPTREIVVREVDRSAESPQSSSALAGQLDRLSSVVESLERTVANLAATGLRAAPAKLQFRRPQRGALDEHHAGVLKEILDSNLALRQEMSKERGGAGQAEPATAQAISTTKVGSDSTAQQHTST